MITYVIAILVVWTISSLWWAYIGLGRKTEPNRWYDYILSPPALLLAVIFGWVAKTWRAR